MDYYVSWTHSDPVFQQFVPDAKILVSPPNVSLSWQIRQWPCRPQALIVDSGAFQYYRAGRRPTPEELLSRQLHILGGEAIDCGFCHPDMPMLGTRNLAELERRVAQNLEQARWLIRVATSHALPPNVRPIGVVQGYSVETVFYVAQALTDMGYTWLALGSLAKLSSTDSNELMRRAEAALEAVGPGLHVLGVSSVTLLPRLSQLGVQSADSGAPIHEAWRGGLFYSRPFRRYKLPSPHFKEWTRNYSFAEILPAPLPCDCPVCLEDSDRLLQPSGKLYVNLRAVHNYFHLRRELTASAA
jgi:tRNA-guanine family transglycosylase